MDGDKKGSVCVTGGTGFVASWLIKRLLEHGYSVNTTVRCNPDGKRDVTYLTSLPGASERLRIFNADLDQPHTFEAAIEGTIGVFHVAHPIDFVGEETEETVTKRSISGTLGILQACLDSKTVKRVVYTSSASTVLRRDKDVDELTDESCWSDIDYLRSSKLVGASYAIAKTLTEKAVLEFAEKHGLDLVTVIPTWIHGPYICPRCPGSVRESLALILGSGEHGLIKHIHKIPFVHTDDVANAHIFLFEYPDAKGRYICSAVEITVEELAEFLSARYPEYQVSIANSLKNIQMSNSDIQTGNISSLSSNKLLQTGFKFKYGLEEMFDGAIECCKQRGIL